MSDAISKINAAHPGCLESPGDWEEFLVGLEGWRAVARGEDIPPFLLPTPHTAAPYGPFTRDAIVALAVGDYDTPEGFVAAAERVLEDPLDDERVSRIAMAIMTLVGDYGADEPRLVEVLAVLAYLTGRWEAANECLGWLLDRHPEDVEAGVFGLATMVAHALVVGAVPPTVYAQAGENLANEIEDHLRDA